MPAKPSIVFAHGLWADGSCFSKVIPALQADGHEVVSAQNSLDTLEGDVATVTRALGRVSSPAILVGHSYGGTVITAAGTDDRVAGLVYIAALAPDADETSQSLQDKFPATDVFAHIEVADGRIWLLPSGIECFAGDLPEQEQKLVWATQGVPAADLFNQKLHGTAWRSKPSWYIVANNDQHRQSRAGAIRCQADGRHTPTRSTAAMCPCSPTPTSCSTSSGMPRRRCESGGIRARTRRPGPPPCLRQRTAVPGRPGRHLRRDQPARHRGAVRQARGEHLIRAVQLARPAGAGQRRPDPGRLRHGRQRDRAVPRCRGPSQVAQRLDVEVLKLLHQATGTA